MALSGSAENVLMIACGNGPQGREIIAAINAGGGSGPFSTGVDATHLGFFGVAAVTRATAYTFTYNTASKTFADATYAATALAPPAVGTPASTGAYDTDAHLAAAVASLTALRVDVIALAADVLQLKKGLVAVATDLKLYGILQ